MPGMDGFEVLEAVGPRAVPAVVFVTAYDQYALKAFDVAAVDYLLKPFDAERFSEAYRRAIERARTKTGEEVLARLLSGVRPGPGPLSRIVVKRQGRIFLVPVGEVVHIAARENYVGIFVAKGSYLIRETLSGLEARLDPEKFVRIHRSGLVNLDHVKEVQPWAHGDCVVILSNGDRVRLSRRYQAGLLGKPSGGGSA